MKKLPLLLLAVLSASAFANDWEDFSPDQVIDLGEIALQQKQAQSKTSGDVTPNAITSTWWPISGTLTAPTRTGSNVWYITDYTLTPTGNWTFETFTYTWLISGGTTSDRTNMDIKACVHYQTSWQACGDVRKTTSSPEFGSSNFAVSFPVQCYLCPSPAKLSLFIRVPGTGTISPALTATFAAGSGKLYYTP